MLIRVERGRILVKLDEGLGPEQAQRIVELIGSAHADNDTDPREVSVACSIQNFRKLKTLGCSLAKDEETVAQVKILRAALDYHEAENIIGAKAKAGAILVAKDYQFKKPPFDHQRVGFQFLHALKTPALFGDCGTGKTYTVLTFFDSLLKNGEKWILLVICPPNLIKHVWQEDTVKFTDLSAVGLRPGASERTKREVERLALFSEDADIYVINPENIRVARKDRTKGDKISLVFNLLRRKRKAGYKTLLAIDESSKMKSRTSATYRAIKDIRSYCDRVVAMTGTPSPNGTLDLWAQFSVLDDGLTLQPSFIDYRHDTHREVVLKNVSWKDRFGNEHNATKWRPRAGAAKQIYEIIQPRMIRFRAEDCLDLPPKQFLVREIELTKEQLAVYSEMEDNLFTELEGDPITAKIAAVKLMKLREITGGFIITDDGKEKPIAGTNPKLEDLDLLLEQSIGEKMGDDGRVTKALVWAQYQWETRMLCARYSKLYGARGLYGGISQRQKDEAITSFHKDPQSRLLVCHPQSAGHGLTLTEASYAFYYSLSYGYEEFYQSMRRIARAGQTRPQFFYFLIAKNSIDEDILAALAEKKSLSDLITDGNFQRQNFLRHRKLPADLTFDWEVPCPDTGTI